MISLTPVKSRFSEGASAGFSRHQVQIPHTPLLIKRGYVVEFT
jgi:hypothetical protein